MTNTIFVRLLKKKVTDLCVCNNRKTKNLECCCSGRNVCFNGSNEKENVDLFHLFINFQLFLAQDLKLLKVGSSLHQT